MDLILEWGEGAGEFSKISKYSFDSWSCWDMESLGGKPDFKGEMMRLDLILVEFKVTDLSKGLLVKKN